MAHAPCKSTATAVGGDEREKGRDANAASDAEEAGMVVEGIVCWVKDRTGVWSLNKDGERGALTEQGGRAGVCADDE